MSEKDVVEEARGLLDYYKRQGMGEPIMVRRLADEVERLRKDNADLTAANISTLLGEIKERLTPEEGQQFHSLLMAATRGWVNEVTERSAVDRGMIEAFKDLPKKRKR